MSLSDVKIRNAKSKAKAYKLGDGDGLYLLVQPTGGKLWRFKYRFAAKEKLLALGSYPDLSLNEARERHREARNRLALGNDPSHEKQEAKRSAILKAQRSFEDVAREWHESRKHTWSPKSAKKVMNSFEADVFPRIGTRPVAEITSSELLSMVRKVEARGALDTAHRMVQYCGRVFSYAIVTDRATNNPVTNLRGALKPVQTKNNAYLREDELPEFMGKLEKYDGNPQTKLALKFLILTFVRTGELRGAKWSEISWEKSEWRIPAERMKMREPHIVPLSVQALRVLEELKQFTGQWALVFPHETIPTRCMSENTILYALYRLGYHSRATGHGFRSSASTILNENGFMPDVIERQLAHSERDQVRAAYNHAQYLPERRKMMQWWGDHLDGLSKN